MTPEILADAANRERLRCLSCGKLPPDHVATAWGTATRWVCGECAGRWLPWPMEAQ